MAKANAPQTRILIDLIDQAYDKRAWHGTNLKGSLRGLSLKQLLWRPGPGRHNIWEIALHTAYWKYAIYRQLTDSDKGSFPRNPSNWPELPARPDLKLWKADLATLNDYHSKLKKAFLKLAAKDLDKKMSSRRWTNAQKIAGVASHDLYHAGQIQLIKRLMKK